MAAPIVQQTDLAQLLEVIGDGIVWQAEAHDDLTAAQVGEGEQAEDRQPRLVGQELEQVRHGWRQGA